jgi:excisionase family DNA binding protein
MGTERNPLYSVPEVADALSLHPKTVARFIREGRIAARKIGREWRVSAADLARYAHGELAGGPEESTSERTLSDRLDVSAVIQLTEANSREVSRIANSLLAALTSKDPSWGDARHDVIFHPETGTARFILQGSPHFLRSMIEMVEVLIATESVQHAGGMR